MTITLGRILAALCVTTAALASPVPPLRVPIPAVPAGPNVPLPKVPTVPARPTGFTLATLDGSALSGVVYNTIKSELTQRRSAGSASLAAPSRATAEVALRGRVRLTPAATVETSVNATTDSAQDVEPYILDIAGGNGADLTVTAYIKYLTAQTPPNLYYKTATTDLTTIQGGALPATGYSETGDPWLAHNPYGSGVAQHRLYCAGIAFNGNETQPNAIAVWHSDLNDNGNFTTSPAIVDSRVPSGATSYFLDKPSIAVSWHAALDLGYVYVAYVSYEYDLDAHGYVIGGNSAIVVARSTDGGVTFPQKTVIAYGGQAEGSTVAGPQVLVNVSTGAVYVLYVEEANSRIVMATSIDNGASFSTYEQAATLSGGYRHDLNGGIRAYTLPMARYNWATGSINVVWHDGTSSTAHLKYAYRDPNNNNAWTTVASITQFTANDQFMPAIDFRDNGDVMISYYDRHADVTNTSYRAYVASAYFWGQRQSSSDAWMGGFDSTTPGTTGLAVFIGDYQGITAWKSADNVAHATAAWTGIQSQTFDVWLSRMLY